MRDHCDFGIPLLLPLLLVARVSRTQRTNAPLLALLAHALRRSTRAQPERRTRHRVMGRCGPFPNAHATRAHGPPNREYAVLSSLRLREASVPPERTPQELTDAELMDLSAALAHAKATGLKMYEGMPLDLTMEKFPLPVLSKRIAALADSLENGTGERKSQPSSASRAATGVSLSPRSLSPRRAWCTTAACWPEDDVAAGLLELGRREGESEFSRRGCVFTLSLYLTDAGAVMISNFPVEGHTEEDIAIMYLGVSAHIGRTVPQSSAGLRSVSRGYGLPLGRVQAEMSGKTPGKLPAPPFPLPTYLSTNVPQRKLKGPKLKRRG